jgi:hypothetical protein
MVLTEAPTLQMVLTTDERRRGGGHRDSGARDSGESESLSVEADEVLGALESNRGI